MENLLNKIKDLIEAYNNLPDAKKMVLVPEEYAKSMNIKIDEEKKDISDMYICLYNNGKVGLFKELRFSSGIETIMGHNSWNAGSLFIGVNSNLVGLRITHQNFSSDAYWEKEGYQETVDKKRYVCNCNMQDAITFDDVRLMMYEDKEISSYELGKASNSEMIQVLKYAKKYYEGKIILGKQKIKK
ncbi:MAG: hypothetical protein IJN90_03635 [Bacilli bacterium]|nr:hypothetical protein [Bacilli bacterium]